MFKLRNAAIDTTLHVFLFELNNVAILIQRNSRAEYAPHIATHSAGIHAQAAANITGNTVHPLKAGNAVTSRKCSKLLQLYTGTGHNVATIEFKLLKLTAAGVNNCATNTTLTHNDVRATANNVNRDATVLEEVDNRLHLLKGAGLNPILSFTTHAHCCMLTHGLIEAVVDVLTAFLLHLCQDAQICGNLCTGFVYITGTEGDEHVSRAQSITHNMVSQAQVRQEACIHRTIFKNSVNNRLTTDTGNRRLACGVHISHIELVNILQHLAEIITQQLRTGIAVGLEQNYQTLGLQALGGLQCSGNFRGVMAIVIHNAVIAGKVLSFKATASTCKAYQTTGNAGKITT